MNQSHIKNPAKRGRPAGSGFDIPPSHVLGLQKQGKSYAEISHELGISITLVSKLLTKARATMPDHRKPDQLQPDPSNIIDPGPAKTRLDRFIDACYAGNVRALGLLDQWEPHEIDMQTVDRTGMAPLRFRGGLIREGSTEFRGTTPNKPNEDFWTVKIYATAAQLRLSNYVVAITYTSHPRRGQTLKMDQVAEFTDHPAEILQAYDPLEVLRGFPDAPQFASRQEYLELISDSTWGEMVSDLLREPL